MGATGPVPNRSEDLARERSRKGGQQVEITKGEALPSTIPEMDENWHDIAKMLWQGMLDSGQRVYFQSSDWAMAYSLCEDLSVYKSNAYKRSGQMLASIYSMMGELLITEGSRRRVRIELEAPVAPSTPASVTAIASYKAELGVAN